MRTRTLIAGIAFLIAGTGAGKVSAQQSLRGSDTLDNLTTQVIANCPGATGNIVYTGGGTGAGQAAMEGASPTQRVAPMSRQLNGASCSANSRQLMIALDGLSILAKNVAHLPPASCTDDIGGAPLVLTGIPDTFIPCSSDTQCSSVGTTCDIPRGFCVPGGTLALCTAAQGCSTPGTYTFDNNSPANPADDWQDVLRLLFGGMFHGTAATMIHSATEANADGTPICFTGGAGGAARNCVRNPARVDCASPVRGVLLASYGQLIRSPVCTVAVPTACTSTAQCPLGQTCNATTGQCQPVECVKIRHAFRRDDLSGTTDAFLALVGLPSLPVQSNLRSGTTATAPEIADYRATVSPFCNGGTAAMNKGFTDGLDLDPYRRACNAGPAPDRLALESVCQGFAAPNNSDVSCYVSPDTRPALYIQKERSAPQGRGVLPGGTVDNAAALAADLRRQRCLGVVQPISIPQELAGATVWAASRFPAGGVCSPGVRAFVNPLPARQMICPDGTIKAPGGTCRLPQNTTVSPARFDCVVDSPLPAGAGINDARVFNLMPVNNVGGMAALLDSYQNPSFPAPTFNPRRFARRYYGVHMVRPDNTASTATITSPCLLTTDTTQIGCLVKASPCSIGFAGREGADDGVGGAPFNNVALRLNNIQATQQNIENLALGLTPVYPMARKLWFNSFQDPAIGFVTPNLSSAEQALSTCMGLPPVCATSADCTAPATCDTGTGRCTTGNHAIVDQAVTDANFIAIPASVQRMSLNASGQGCPLPL